MSRVLAAGEGIKRTAGRFAGTITRDGLCQRGDRVGTNTRA
jgi:hypothetical protein